MSQASGPNRKVVTIVALISVLAISGIAYFILLSGGSQSEVNTHRGQWAARDFNGYEMKISVKGLAQCQSKYQVRDEQIVSGAGNANPACAQYTVSELFDLIENTGGCGPNGCACDGPLGAEVTYDQALGYPTRIVTRLFPEKRFLYPDYWKKQVFGGGCTLVGYVGVTIEVMSLTPFN